MQIEAQQDVIFDYIKKGSIMNAHNFLAQREPVADVKCMTSVTYYYLTRQKLKDISENYPKLRNAMKKAQKIAKYNKMLEIEHLDY